MRVIFGKYPLKLERGKGNGKFDFGFFQNVMQMKINSLPQKVNRTRDKKMTLWFCPQVNEKKNSSKLEQVTVTLYRDKQTRKHKSKLISLPINYVDPKEK